MTFKTESLKDNKTDSSVTVRSRMNPSVMRVIGFLGVAIAAPFFLWVPLGLTGLTPSMIDVFGVVGMRFPAAVTISGLLIASIGFHQL
jgi:hypothetical protein